MAFVLRKADKDFPGCYLKSEVTQQFRSSCCTTGILEERDAALQSQVASPAGLSGTAGTPDPSNNVGPIQSNSGIVAPGATGPITQVQNYTQPLSPMSDVSLCFVQKKHPILWVLNRSNVPVEHAVFMPVMFDLDALAPDEPLQMISRTFELVSPRARSGGYDVFAELNASPALKYGDRVVGSVGITCPHCVTGRTYYVSIIWGHDGWFSQVAGESSGNALVMMDTSDEDHPHTSSAATWEVIRRVPEQERISMRTLKDLTDDAHNIVASNCEKR